MPGSRLHYMVQWMDRETTALPHMGGRSGRTGYGESKFLNARACVFSRRPPATGLPPPRANLLAIGGGIAAKTNITYKILY